MLAKALLTHRRYLTLVILAIIAVGYTSFTSMGRQEDPTITPFVAKIQTFFPGASPTRVEALITKPLEDAIREVPEVIELKSTSSSGVSVISVEVDYRLPQEEINRVWSELRDIIGTEAARFPPGTTAPELEDDLITAFVKIIAITSARENDVPASLLRREAELFADAARKVPLTKRVMMYGMPQEEVLVELNESRLASLGISIDEITAALAGADPKSPAGKLSGSGTAIAIELSGEFESLDAVRQVQIRATAEGRVLRLQDIATIVKSERTPAASFGISNGRRSVLVGVEMNQGYKVDTYSSRFDEFLAAYTQQAPAGILIETSYDQAGYTRERLAGVATNLLMGIALVLLVLLFTLGWRAALVVAVVLPLCTLLSMIVLHYLDVPIHQMSLTGLVVALGLLVDGSIVMADEVRKRLLEGLRPMDAMSGAVSRLRIPLVSSTLTTVLAFMPMAILEGPAGDFLGSIAISVITMLVSSMLLALTVTPVLAARLLPGGISDNPRWWQAGANAPRLSALFRRTLSWSMRNPMGSIVLALALPITGYLTVPTLTNQFFPGTDRDQFYLQITMPNSASIEDSLALAQKIDEDLRSEPLIRRVDWTVGESAPAFYYNLRSNKQGIPGFMEALVLTTDENLTDPLIRRLQKKLDQRYPQAQIIVRGIDQGPPVEAPLEVLVIGPNIGVLKSLGEQFRQRLENLPDVTHTQVSMGAGPPKMVFELDEEKLRRAGLQRTSIANTIDGALRGRTGGELLEDTERLPVRARLNPANWMSTDDIKNLHIPVTDNTGQTVASIPLQALGESSLVPDDSPITRDEGERVNKIQGFLTRGILPEEAFKLLRANLKENPIAMPLGYRFSFGGDSDERAQVVSDLMAPLGLILSGLVATVLLTFNSWRLTVVAVLVCACSFGLSLLALAIFRYPLGIQALIGVIGSIGVSINAAIIILTALQQDAGASRGELSSIRSVVMDSSRHIVSTTVTTFGGFLPLILEGSQFWPPFAMAIAGGVLLSTVISFYLVPPLFLVTLGKPQQNSERDIGSSMVAAV